MITLKLKRITITGLLFFTALRLINGQGTTSFTFTALFASVHKPLDSIRILNITGGTDTLLYANDTVLNLQTTSSPDYGYNSGLKDLWLFPPYPNPAIGNFTLKFFSSFYGRIMVVVSDITGRETASLSQFVTAGYHRYSIDIQHPGQYMVTVVTPRQQESAKIICTGMSEGVTEIRYQGVYKLWDYNRKASSAFTWYPGDKLRFTGYAQSDSLFLLHDVIEDNPMQSTGYKFNLLTGLPCEDEPFVTDINGNSYRTVKVGTQCWLRQNLRTTRFANGTPVPVVSNNSIWISLFTPGMCWYNNDSVSYDSLYGALYNWYSIWGGNLCPSGWHIPEDNEWQVLEISLGMTPSDAILTGYRGTGQGNKLKESGTSVWAPPNSGADNSSGFSGLPAGKRSDGGGDFSGMGNFGYWWTSSGYLSDFIWYRILSCDETGVFRGYHNKGHGYSVRCIRN